MTSNKIVIIGAGMTGLSCAHVLQRAGESPIVLDKGRGIGGRLATRRTEQGLQFDHGAQYVTARDSGFRDFLNQAETAGAAAQWDIGGETRFVGAPGMNALAKRLGEGLDIRQNALVTGLEQTSSGWHLLLGDQALDCEQLVITVPAPQVADLLGPAQPLAVVAQAVVMAPCLTLMAAFRPDQPCPFVTRRDANDDLSWIAQNNTKPGRPTNPCWVAQASPKWSAEPLELDPNRIAELMLPMLCDRLGANPEAAIHAVAHRWRYARVEAPLGTPFLRNDDQTLYLGGDWCLGARVEAAWESGTAIANDILGYP